MNLLVPNDCELARASSSLMLSDVPKFLQWVSENQVWLQILGSFPYISVSRFQMSRAFIPWESEMNERREYPNTAGKNNPKEEMVKKLTDGWAAENVLQTRRGASTCQHPSGHGLELWAQLLVLTGGADWSFEGIVIGQRSSPALVISSRSADSSASSIHIKKRTFKIIITMPTLTHSPSHFMGHWPLAPCRPLVKTGNEVLPQTSNQKSEGTWENSLGVNSSAGPFCGPARSSLPPSPASPSWFPFVTSTRETLSSMETDSRLPAALPPPEAQSDTCSSYMST